MTSPRTTSRRQFLFAGGVSALGAATLAACSGSSVVNTSGTIPTTDVAATAPPTTVDPAMLEAERSILRTATSLEYSLAAFYDKFKGAAYLDDDAKSWGDRFGQHHTANAKALEQLTTSAGGDPYTDPNAYLDDKLITPGLELADASESAADLIVLAAGLEATGAATDTLAVDSLTAADTRAGIMAVGATNSRQAYFWRLRAAPGELSASLPDALLSLQDALPAAASVDAADDTGDDADGDTGD